jgi:high-affinity Fe2+/Pb2+ permease
MNLIDSVLFYYSMAESLFKPRKSRKIAKSDNSKTVANRKSEERKRGLEAALTKANSSYRTTKSRKLKKLREFDTYRVSSLNQQQEAKEELLADLQSKYDDKVIQLHLKWQRKVKANDLSDDEDDTLDHKTKESSHQWSSNDELMPNIENQVVFDKEGDSEE